MMGFQSGRGGEIALLDDLDRGLEEGADASDVSLVAIRSGEPIQFVPEEPTVWADVDEARATHGQYLELVASGAGGIALVLLLRERGALCGEAEVKEALEAVGAGRGTLRHLEVAGFIEAGRGSVSLTGRGQHLAGMVGRVGR
jgi:hypothetical protein